MEAGTKTYRYPFKFLDPYLRADREIFFGREQEIEELYQRVFRSNLLLVYGRSGTGKTSLVQCGLASRFSSMDWFELFIRRGQDINASLGDAIANAIKTPMTTGLTLYEKLESLYLDHFKPIYLIFDQFEELFILGNSTEQSRFIRDIASVLDRKIPVKVIVVMREEYLAQLYDFERILPTIMDNRMRIEHMGRSNAISMIRCACERAEPPIKLEEGIEQKIVDIVTEEKGRVQLTYLQVFLDKMYRLAEEKGTTPLEFTSEILGEAGKIDDVLEDFVDMQIKDFSAQYHHKALPLTFLKVFVSRQGTKVPLQKATVYQRLSNINKDKIDTCLQFFESRRILRPLENDLYELAHDSIAAKIAAASVEAYKLPTLLPGYSTQVSAVIGFKPYAQEHARVFYGRDHEIQTLFDLVMNDSRSRSTLVYGKLGSGKTSLLCAGVIPRIEQFRKVRYLHITPQIITKEIAPYLREGTQPVRESLLWTDGSASPAKVVIWDQIEEWFSSFTSREELMTLFQWMADGYNRFGDTEFIWCIREEYFAQFTDLESYLPGFMDKKKRVEALTPEQARNAVQSIALHQKLEFDDDEALSLFMQKLTGEDGRIEPTYLQVYLQRILDLQKTEAA
ncbi:MAG TPA: ATP-binding protein [Saprospiraceae bacterium]|nr:ATP-binding protein [Saprospiraceae bacterium]